MCTQLPTLSKPPLLTGDSSDEKRAHLKSYFIETWELYESLFSLINNDPAYYLRPEPLRHPLIFYYGHTAVFYINKLMLGKYIEKRVNPDIESICAVGVDEMSWDDLKPDNYDWPEVNVVRQYRDEVKALVLNIIDEMPLELPIQQDSLAWVVLMGIEHERIHIETSSVIMRMMSLENLTPSNEWRACTDSGNAPDNTLIAIPASNITLGKTNANPTYGWDNEYGTLDVAVDEFAASQFLVSNQEFMSFIEAGGYETPEYWTEEGQSWLSFKQAKMPGFWLYRDGQYWQRNLTEEIPLPMDWPAEVNYLEAKAFCNWKAKQEGEHIRLPTEAEWQVLRNNLDTDLPFWQQAPGNINLEHFASSCPVNKYQMGELYDVIGNVWQWTESPIDGYDGFSVHPLYDDFSTPTFDGKHNLIKGGSWISTGNEATRDSRYAFRRHFYQHAGFRYIKAKSAEVPLTPVNPFETQPEICQHLHNHYQGQQGCEDLLEIARVAADLEGNQSKALDIGCATGRLAFELAKRFEAVDGIDFTARNIQHALQLKEQGQLRYVSQDVGELVKYHEVSLSELGLEDVAHKVQFLQGDAHNLKPQFTGYDVIVCHRVLEHLYDPALFLNRIMDRLNPSGYLVLSSAYNWDQEKTKRDKWLGGFKKDGEDLLPLEAIKDVLHPYADLKRTAEVEAQLTVNARSTIMEQCELSVWQKR